MTGPAVHTTSRKVKYLRIDTTSPDTQVHSAGACWAGRSELPLAQFTPAQLVELKTDQRLQVEEIDREVDPDAT